MYTYGKFFNFGSDEKYISELSSSVLNFYKSILPLVDKDVTLSFKCKENDDNNLYFYVSVVILEPNDIGPDTGETAFELISGKGLDITQALENILENIKSCTVMSKLNG